MKSEQCHVFCLSILTCYMFLLHLTFDIEKSQILEIGEKWLQFSSCFVLACFYRLNLEKCEPNIGNPGNLKLRVIWFVSPVPRTFQIRFPTSEFA